MRSMIRKAAALIGILAMTAPILLSRGTPKIYAQKLVDEVVAKHPDLLVFAMHVTAPGVTDNTIIASNVPSIIGKKSDADDLKAIDSPQPVTEVSKDGTRFEVLLPLRDRTGKAIGALVTVFPYKAGDDQKKLIRRAAALRNQVQRQIPSLAGLFGQA